MILVMDTSAAAGIILGRQQAAEMGARVAESDWVIAPTLYIAEITNVFWKYYRFADLTMEQCETAIDRAVELIDDFFHEKALYREAFAMACLTQQPVYDMFFLVLAWRTNGFILTLDEALHHAAKKNAIRVLPLQNT